MGVDHTVYAMIGVMIRDEEQKKYVREVMDEYPEDFFESPNCPITVLIDYMCGRYIAIGTVISAHDRYGDGDVTETTLAYLQNAFPDIRMDIHTHFPELKPVFVQLHTFSHFS